MSCSREENETNKKRLHLLLQYSVKERGQKGAGGDAAAKQKTNERAGCLQ